jgi:hypothetical protein
VVSHGATYTASEAVQPTVGPRFAVAVGISTLMNDERQMPAKDTASAGSIVSAGSSSAHVGSPGRGPWPGLVRRRRRVGGVTYFSSNKRRSEGSRSRSSRMMFPSVL